MNLKIAEFQKVISKITSEFEENKDVLALLAYGSLVSGDLWEESDIDLLVIIKNELDGIKDIYIYEENIPVHYKLISKSVITDKKNKIINKMNIDKILISSKLIFSKDDDITKIHRELRYFPDNERQRMNLVYLGETLKVLSVLKKYMYNHRDITSYEIAVKCIDSFSKLYINNSDYLVSKDAITMAINLNDDFKIIVENVFFSNEDKAKSINSLIKYIDKYIRSNIKNCCSFLIEHIKNTNNWVTSQLLKEDELFRDLSINMEDILKELYKNKLLKSKVLMQSLNGFRYKENVYFYDTL
ncbi:nucleotidyltransferase domain-containing protein [Clostridium paridis]|uniref:Nucleotidyltransferase domain-containing protein n=1 Tax=Clostridium paridis TaxID=2803863 RepID=A0A937K547_9CLOT|nr:nucleotidyltransferase domain-containing protein [Clostridium paridis]